MEKLPAAYTEEQVLQAARSAYKTGQAAFELDWQRAALLLIDMQLEFVLPGYTPYWVPEATRITPRLAGLLDAARQARMPVIHTAFADSHHYLDRPYSGPFMPNRYPDLPKGGHEIEARFIPDLSPRPEDIVLYKPSYGAFYDTPLDTILRNLGCDTVIVTGTLTNVCCGMTARQAYERGYKVIFGSDVTATHSPELQDAELQTLRYAFARVMTAAEIIRAIGGESELA